MAINTWQQQQQQQQRWWQTQPEGVEQLSNMIPLLQTTHGNLAVSDGVIIMKILSGARGLCTSPPLQNLRLFSTLRERLWRLHFRQLAAQQMMLGAQQHYWQQQQWQRFKCTVMFKQLAGLELLQVV
jgi:hypothetical protein